MLFHTVWDQPTGSINPYFIFISLNHSINNGVPKIYWSVVLDTFQLNFVKMSPFPYYKPKLSFNYNVSRMYRRRIAIPKYLNKVYK